MSYSIQKIIGIVISLFSSFVMSYGIYQILFSEKELNLSLFPTILVFGFWLMILTYGISLIHKKDSDEYEEKIKAHYKVELEPINEKLDELKLNSFEELREISDPHLDYGPVKQIHSFLTLRYRISKLVEEDCISVFALSYARDTFDDENFESPVSYRYFIKSKNGKIHEPKFEHTYICPVCKSPKNTAKYQYTPEGLLEKPYYLCKDCDGMYIIGSNITRFLKLILLVLLTLILLVLFLGFTITFAVNLFNYNLHWTLLIFVLFSLVSGAMLVQCGYWFYINFKFKTLK